MDLYKLESFTKGWIIGDFIPNIIETNAFEFAIKEYREGDKEDKHFHKIAKEITVVVSGKIKMNDCVLEKGDIILIQPGEEFKFEALEDCITAVIKTPSAKNDKFITE